MSERVEALAKEFLSLSQGEQKEVVMLIQSVFGGGQRGGFTGDKVLGETTINFAPQPGGRCPKCGR
jgi:hypothetical protein